jgi:hypothetical protein
MLLQTSTIGHDDFLLSFEFAHVLVFFVALILMVHAAFFSWTSRSLRMRIKQAATLETTSLLTRYYAGRQHFWSNWGSQHKFLFDYHIIRMLFIKVCVGWCYRWYE